MQPIDGPLAGVRVLEFSQIVAAPVCGVNLADLGADVIKVEPPGGEQTRRSGSVVEGESKGFQALNRGKRSLVVDMHDPRGREVVQRLIPSTDVVTTNYRLGVAERMGIDYESLCVLRPDMIYWQNTGFGERGPEAYRAGSDIVAQAYTGLMVSDAKTNDDGAPELISIPIADIVSGFAAAMGICAALFHRERTGEGQRLDTSLLRTGLFLQAAAVMREPVTDSIVRDPMVEEIERLRTSGGSYGEMLVARQRRQALRTAFRLYYGAYRASDGAVVLGALTKANRDAMRRVLAIEGERSDEPDYDARDPANIAEAEAWRDEIRRRFLKRTAAEWVADFDAAGVPVAPVQVPELVADDPQVVAEGVMAEVTHSVTGPQRVVGPAVNMHRTPTRVQRASPALGEHSAQVLLEGGYAASEVSALADAGVVICREPASRTVPAA